MYHFGCWAYQVCSNDDPRLTLTYSRSNLLPSAFKFDIFLKVDFLKLLKPKPLFSLHMLKGNDYKLVSKFKVDF